MTYAATLTHEEIHGAEAIEVPVVHLNISKILSGTVTVPDLPHLEATGQYKLLITALRTFVRDDKRIFTDPWVKSWCAKRWRNFFIVEAAKDSRAITWATYGNWIQNAVGFGDTRCPEQKVAERFLKGTGPEEWIWAVQGEKNIWSEQAMSLRGGVAPLPPVQMPESVAKETGCMFCPGLLNGLVPVRAFDEGFPALERDHNLSVLRVDAHPLRGCHDNMVDYTNAFKHGIGLSASCTPHISPEHASLKKFCISYSKGTPDLLTFLTEHPSYAESITSLFVWAGAVYGSYIADSAASLVTKLPVDHSMGALIRAVDLLCPVVDLRRIGPLSRINDIRATDAVKSLMTAERTQFMKEHGEKFTSKGGWDKPIFCVTGSTVPEDVPYFQAPAARQLRMYDNNNDMQLTTRQSIVESDMAIHLGIVNANHWDMSFSEFPMMLKVGSSKFKHPFPKTAAVTAMFYLVAELGLCD
ncbi:hypothetical protein SpCBS45565_g03201 [Spizellomyces sp. 'palustris']|nr:hypothetical protein SpCBS45565_g03201 [Spizellomyces sp. 'palustris']